MESTQKDLVIHLIIQDLLYHRMIYGVQKHEVHIEFYPDLASAVLQLMGHDMAAQEDSLTDTYNQFMGKVDGAELDSDLQVRAWAEECYLALASA
jgi:hypothetical protein